MGAATHPTHAEHRPRSRGMLRRFWDSTIGKKIVMAASGLVMAGFLVTHMTANLLAFGGPHDINAYSAFLHSVKELLWLARIVLIVSVVLHVIAAYQLTRISQQARPVGYAEREPQISTIASRTMRIGGVMLTFFIVFHILHFTTGTLHPAFAEGNPYANLVTGFTSNKGVAVFYIVMMVLIGLHLYHGTWSAIRTLGLVRPSSNPFRRRLATGLAVALWLGFTAVPVGVLAGIIGPEPAASATANAEPLLGASAVAPLLSDSTTGR
jgi:succinate dehydrogenase / fumarate reductase cytochrome b subunit